MNEKKQTAVDWLENQLKLSPNDWINIHPYFEQAKEMEKQQIEDAFNIGFKDIGLSYLTGELYYNETYGGNK
jgi:hypothetical protein